MKQAAKRILSFVIVLCIAFLGVITMPMITAKAATYEETNFCEGKLLITTTYNGSTYYLPATTTSSSPTAEAFTDVSEIGEEHLWTVTATGENYYIQNSEGKYLYTNSSNSGVRVGSTQHAWKYDSTANSFQNTTTSRYLGIYNADDWRCYTTVNQSNYKESSTSFVFYKVDASASSISVSGDAYTQVGGTIQLEATLANVEGVVAWSSSDENVATVDQNGLVTAKAMGKATITADVNGTQGTKEVTVYPVENSELTITDALTVCELTGTANSPYAYSTTGVVESIDTEYNANYNNITVTIGDGANSIVAYRMAGGEDLEVGTKIKVTGNLVTYGTTPEFIAGCTYETVADDAATANIKEALNDIQAYMSLGYKYTQATVGGGVTDTLNRDLTGVTGNSYAEWSDKTATSDAVYAGQSAGGNSSIQLRSSNNNSGIVTTVSGGKAKTITVEWNSNTTNGRTLNVYGSNTAYTAATDLYSEDTQGTLLGTIEYGTSTKLEITGDYAYIGLRSKSNAMYLSKVEIFWENETKSETKLSDSDFRIRCGVDAGLSAIDGIDSYGIRVTANGKSMDYNTTANSWANDSEASVSYVVIGLGDIINDLTKLETVFTVQAYAVVDGIAYVSENVKTYSVAGMVAEYYDGGQETVEHLYNYLVKNGLIGEVA